MSPSFLRLCDPGSLQQVTGGTDPTPVPWIPINLNRWGLRPPPLPWIDLIPIRVDGRR